MLGGAIISRLQLGVAYSVYWNNVVAGLVVEDLWMGFIKPVVLGFTPHLAPNTTNPRSAIDARTTRHSGHAISQRIRKRIEEPFGWIKTIAGGRKLRYIGQARNRAWFKITAAVYNLIRITALDTRTA